MSAIGSPDLRNIEWHLVESSNVNALGWEDSFLYVRFHSGSAYVYEGVPESLFQGMLSAPSKGKFLHHVIKPNYGFLKVI